MTSPENTQNAQKLKSLYPFLHNKKTDSANMRQALLNSIEQKRSQHQFVIEQFFGTNSQNLIDCAKTIADTYRQHGQLFTMGNGGSSSDASHIAVEFLHPVTTGRPALAAYDLTSDKTLISAISNDVGYPHAHARQVAILVKAQDCLIGISTSGNSVNLVRAFEQAQKLGARTIALTGGQGGEMAGMGLDHCLIVESDSIHRTQECHVIIYHMLWDLVHTLLADERGNLADNSNNT